MPSSTIRRQMKNMVNNYSDAEKKVRESTSNDPWGPSSSLMSEIADLTYNVVAFSEIMSMIWKRLNDHGKNWRHVYKALTLLDYLIKTGSERVALQCKENIFAIQTLKDFQYIDRDGKDQGINVREKSKQLVVLLKDEERLKGERSQALKTKERMAQVSTGGSQMGFGRGSSQPNLSTSYSEEYGRSEGSPASYHGSTSPNAGSELEQARPQTSGEEELQLQLALAMSREAADQEDRIRRGDDLRLQMALEESKKGGPGSAKLPKKKKEPQSSLLDLMDVPAAGASADPWGPGARARAAAGAGAGAAAASADPWQSYGSSPKPAAPVDPWGVPPSVPPMKSSDPWANSAPAADPWGSAATRPKTSNTGSFDLFNSSNGTSKEDFSEFDSLRSSSSVPTGDGGITSSIPSQASLASSGSLDLFDHMPTSMNTNQTRKTPESFLGPNAALVNLDSLVTKPAQPPPVVNPFLASTGGTAPAAAAAAHANPFQVSQPAPPTLNQMRVSPMPSGFAAMPESIGLSAMPAQPITMVPVAGMAPIGLAMPGMGVSGGLGMGASMSMPQPLMSMPPQGQPTGTTNPFLL
ncbi:epsin-2 isoform X1 [Pleuronectes platessa]|uniref:epsin-2 isoform X1 n=1 Tax=Pleuronectes platessa TaxID=8262 RepID=UPI00232A6991|nr:epsin-2 isoform X1 [Pleuronectes platessa]XP_053298875.1 epsin-2 isoform X1 [Pleuronectes platessa]XP_053298876.1 epsin-2 isoform X1 [Pleuronectes platessa]